MSTQPFTIGIPQSTLDDLCERLARTRWIDEVENSSWEHGISLEYTRELVDYWLHTYDWRKHEVALNTFAQFKANIDGVNIHIWWIQTHLRDVSPEEATKLLQDPNEMAVMQKMQETFVNEMNKHLL